MQFQGFTDADFDVFSVPGLEARMEVLKQRVRPKLVQLGEDLAPFLSEQLGVEMFAHVAKHARRTVNPPNDSWVAFCSDKRGYKKHPHFQVGLWQTHAFATFGLISESGDRAHFAAQVKRHAADVVARIPGHFEWFLDHTNPAGESAAEVDRHRLVEMADRLASLKQGELLVGIRIPREEAVTLSSAQFMQRVQNCFAVVTPLYDLATKEGVLG
ncbi:UPF0637 protein YktB [Alicyclobacillus contaminans]|uniref:YktB family protein n=1 Tax=Alicyclobacillus contaminans TaxID=392016 RepID=UPI00042562EE|nr:DUF1054 domain-containing protein [Alicyclobacillus contaminans]GMA50229.1 UPF0637 protein YktB [Alicyclobacillus contaminans]